LHRSAGRDRFIFGATSSELFRYFKSAIEGSDGKAFRGHIKDKIFAHDREADQANITLIRAHFGISLSKTARAGTQCSGQLERMANPVCEVLLIETELQLPVKDP